MLDRKTSALLTSTRTAIFSLSYHWLPRLSSITSFTFERVRLFADDRADDSDDDDSEPAQDRFQYTLAEGLQFSLTRRTNLVLQYRYLIVDYDSAPRDSTTHFALVGFDHHLTEDLRLTCWGVPHFALSKMTAARLIRTAQVRVNYRGSQPFAKLDNNLWSRTVHQDARNGDHDVPNRPERNVRSNFAHQRESCSLLL